MAKGAAPCDAVAFDRGRIVAVGSRAEVMAAVGVADVVELDGRAVVPGFIDVHHHMCSAALLLHAVPCGPARVRSHDELVHRLAEAARGLPDGAWLVGSDYDAQRLPDGRHPTREHLDAACADRPVLLFHYSHHEVVAGSLALRAAGIDRNSPDPPGGVIERDRRGTPTGQLIETAMGRCAALAEASLVEHHAGDFAASIAAHAARLFASGITRIHDPIVNPTMERLYAEARASGQLRIPIVTSPLAPGGFMEASPERLDGAPTGEGDDAIRIGQLKIVLDGGERCAM